MIKAYQEKLKTADIVCLQDYNKGILTRNVIQQLIETANQEGILTTVDPKKENFFDTYKGETKEIEIDNEMKTYAVVGRMDDPEIASAVVNFFDFLLAS